MYIVADKTVFLVDFMFNIRRMVLCMKHILNLFVHSWMFSLRLLCDTIIVIFRVTCTVIVHRWRHTTQRVKNIKYILLFFTCCDVFCDLLQYTCNLFVLYNKNSNGLLKDLAGMIKEKKVCWRDLTYWIWRHLCVSFNRSQWTTNENAHRSHVIV